MQICVFCGSKFGKAQVYRQTAQALGRAIASHGHKLVYGGASVGTMGTLADSALAAGGEVVGVMPKGLDEREISHTRLTKLYVVDDMHQRKAKMAELADAFIALPGGIGTLEELFEVLTWRQLEIHTKPTILINTQGFYDALLEFLAHTQREQFSYPDSIESMHVVTDVGSAMAYLK
jgi:uncharacterized protein (TIGR00730 family)